LHRPGEPHVIISAMRPRASHRRRALGAAALAAGALAVAGVSAAQEPGPPDAPVVLRDAVDTAGGLDLTRVQLQRASDGRLRAALTLAAPWRMRDLPAEEGPPGSLCLRMWTRTEPVGAAPDYLLCITADARGRRMRGSLLVERDGELRRVAGSRGPASARSWPASRRRRSGARRGSASRPRRRRRDARASPASTPRRTRRRPPR
jgi:hypothetical protein